MREKRQHSRRPVRYVPLSTPVAGEVRDVSPQGMKIEIFQALTVGQRYTFAIGAGETRVKLRGQVRWCRFIGTRPHLDQEKAAVFAAGIVFLMIDGDPPGSLLV